jgi:hypothetical protein
LSFFILSGLFDFFIIALECQRGGNEQALPEEDGRVRDTEVLLGLGMRELTT